MGIENATSPVAALKMLTAFVFTAAISSIAALEKKDTELFSVVYFWPHVRTLTARRKNVMEARVAILCKLVPQV